MEGIAEFMAFGRKIKNLKRAGWLRYIHPSNAESVADHSFGVALHFLALSDENLHVNGQLADRKRCTMMAIVHDIAESIVGDITPLDPISPAEKTEKERNAIHSICKSLDPKRAKEIIELWEEYERGETPEAMLVKDADKLDMITQAFEYEKEHGVNLQEFFSSTEKIFKTTAFKSLSENTRRQREEFFYKKEKEKE